MTGCARSRFAQAGASLIEVLVTLVSTSVGLLGVAALHLVALRDYEISGQRVQASTLASSMLEQVRSDVRHATEYDVQFNSSGVSEGRARTALAAWQKEIDRSLPGGPEHSAGAVHIDSSSGRIQIVIRWSSARGSKSGADLYLELSSRI